MIEIELYIIVMLAFGCLFSGYAVGMMSNRYKLEAEKFKKLSYEYFEKSEMNERMASRHWKDLQILSEELKNEIRKNMDQYKDV